MIRRGAKAYATYAKEYPANFRIKAVAEPNDVRRESFAKEYEISDEFCFKDYKEVLERPKFADCVLVCTQDHEHFEPVMLALRKGYHVRKTDVSRTRRNVAYGKSGCRI